MTAGWWAVVAIAVGFVVLGLAVAAGGRKVDRLVQRAADELAAERHAQTNGTRRWR